jgi:hypothetical protein
MPRIVAVLGALILASIGLIFLFARLNSGALNTAVKSQVDNYLPVTSSKPIPDFPESTESKTSLASSSLTKGEMLQILEASVSALQLQITALKRSSPVTPITNLTQTTPPTNSGPKIAYIPIGYGGSGASSSDFVSVSGQEVIIDPSSYPGYKQMVLEANFRVFQGNGTGYVRLFNKTDGTSITSSQISTTSQDYSTQASSGFSLPSGSKTYDVQVKSTTGYSVDLQLAHIRVDF